MIFFIETGYRSTFSNTPKPESSGTPKVKAEKINAAQLEMINKLKTNPMPSSPLAFANAGKENGTILIKKRKNVPKCTVATQTIESYIQKHPFSKSNFN